MTKKELIKYLRNRKQSALKAAKQMQIEILESIEDTYYDRLKLTKRASEMLPLVLELKGMIDDYAENVKSIDKAIFNAYSFDSLYRILDSVSTQDLLEKYLKNSTKFSSCEYYASTRRKLLSQYQSVINTYDTVIRTVEGLPSIKECLEYIEKIGFNISEVESEVKEMTSEKSLPATTNVNIDPRYLLLNKRGDEINAEM